MLLKQEISMWLPVYAHRSLIAHGCSVENCSLNFFRFSLSRGEKFKIFSWLCRFCSNFFSIKKGMFSQLRACVALFSPVLASGAFIDEKREAAFFVYLNVICCVVSSGERTSVLFSGTWTGGPHNLSSSASCSERLAEPHSCFSSDSSRPERNRQIYLVYNLFVN